MASYVKRKGLVYLVFDVNDVQLKEIKGHESEEGEQVRRYLK